MILACSRSDNLFYFFESFENFLKIVRANKFPDLYT